MGKTKCKSKLYKLRLVKTDEPVLWGHNYSDEWDALCEAMLKDLERKKSSSLYIQQLKEGHTRVITYTQYAMAMQLLG